MFDDRNDIHPFNLIGFGCSPEDFFILLNSLVPDCIVDILHTEKPSLVDDFLLDHLALKVLFHIIIKAISMKDILKVILHPINLRRQLT
jgi:hypothetical protein